MATALPVRANRLAVADQTRPALPYLACEDEGLRAEIGINAYIVQAQLFASPVHAILESWYPRKNGIEAKDISNKGSIMHVRSRVPGIAVAALLTFFLTAAVDAADRQPQVPDLKVEKYTLANGLDVLMLEDHSTPVVGVNLWYKVGSKNEKAGRTGFAHLFEHMMFQGSEHHDNEYFAPIEKLGAQINGSTNTDRTNYFETLPSNGLELALWLESDRMGFLLPALTQAKLDNQRDVVKNERRQSVDNVPYGQSREKMLEALYPPDHPYHHSVIGSMADLSAASRADVSAFFRTYYTPNNASLAIVGDFKPEEAKRLVEMYFGPIPAGPNVAKLNPTIPKLGGPKHVTMTDRVSLARVQLAWPTVERGHPDESALEVLGSVLGQLPKENRLYRTLVFDKQLAVQAVASSRLSELAGTFDVMIDRSPGSEARRAGQDRRRADRATQEGGTDRGGDRQGPERRRGFADLQPAIGDATGRLPQR